MENTIFCANNKPKSIGKRTLRFKVSDESLTRGTFIVKQSGWDFSRFKENPVVLFDHVDDYVVANAVKIWVDQTKLALMMDIEFLPKGMFDKADLLFDTYSSGFTKGISAGFSVKQVEYPEKVTNEEGPMQIYTKMELLEVSLVAVPANQNTLVTNKYVSESIDSGLVTQEQVDTLSAWVPNLIGDVENKEDRVTELESENLALKLQLKEEETMVEDDIYKEIWSKYVGYDDYKKGNIYDDIMKKYVG